MSLAWLQVFFALTMTAMGVSGNVNMIPDLDKVKSSVASIFEIIDSKPKIDSINIGGLTIETIKGRRRWIPECHL